MRRKFLLILFFILLVLIRSHFLFQEPVVPTFTNKITVYGNIIGEPDVRESSLRLTVKLNTATFDNQTYYLDEKVIVTTGLYPNYETGDKVKIYGEFKKPSNFENENGIEFDYVNFLAKDRIYSLSYYPKIEKVGDSDKDFTKNIFKIKQKFLENIQSVIPSPESELLGGILLGTKRSLGKELEDDFRKVGLIHIVVLSGYNVTIIAEAFFRFFRFLPRVFATTFGVLSVIMFAIMVGSGATIVRSTIMTLLAITARVSGRTYHVNRALFLAGGIMVLHNPVILLYDPSFQLSFVATFGLINFSDFTKKFLKFIPTKFELREITTATITTQFSVLPLLIKMTGEVSVVAPIVNVLTLQIIPITMLFGFLAGVGTFIHQSIGMFVGFVPYLFLKYILIIVEFFADFDFATLVT